VKEKKEIKERKTESTKKKNDRLVKERRKKHTSQRRVPA